MLVDLLTVVFKLTVVLLDPRLLHAAYKVYLYYNNVSSSGNLCKVNEEANVIAVYLIKKLFLLIAEIDHVSGGILCLVLGKNDCI